MAVGNFERSLAAVLKHEGGYVDHPSDPGGATNMGITRATLASWRGVAVSALPKSEVKNLTKAEAGQIYRSRYWNMIRGDDLPAGIDYALFDYAVNSGPSRAVKHLQDILGVSADGLVGPVTIGAIGRWNIRDLIERLSQRRMKFLEGLSAYPVFGRGWSLRVGEVRTLALSMVTQAGPMPPDYAPPDAPPPAHRPGFSPAGAAIIALILAAIAAAFFMLH